MISLIVAKANNNVIGSKNDLPWYLPADLRHFKEITTGHTVVMGRTTFNSILSRLGKPLPNRENVVITRDQDFSYHEVTVIHSIDEIKTLGDVYVIGGAEIYRQTIDIADRLYVTEVHADIDGDTYFPSLSVSWKEVSRESHTADDKNPHDYDFVVYVRS
jgi:dihydrofolate reductase